MLIRPILEYANVAWFPFTNKHVGALERVQRKAARFIYNRYRRTDSPTALLKRADLPTLASRAKLHSLRFLYLMLHNSLKINPASYVKANCRRQTRNKHCHTLDEYPFKNNVFGHSFFPRAVRAWNALHPTVLTQPTVDKFVVQASESVLSFV